MLIDSHYFGVGVKCDIDCHIARKKEKQLIIQICFSFFVYSHIQKNHTTEAYALTEI